MSGMQHAVIPKFANLPSLSGKHVTPSLAFAATCANIPAHVGLIDNNAECWHHLQHESR